MPSLGELGGGWALAAGRPALRCGGQSAEEHRAGPQVTPVMSPLRPLPGLPGVRLHLAPRLPPQVELQQSPLLRSRHAASVVYILRFGGIFPFINYPKCISL